MIRALVLSAGRGERLRPLTDTVPKPLVEIGCRPLIHYPLLMLKRAGIREVAINAHHLAHAMESALRTGSQLGIEIVWSPEPTLLGTGGPLNGLRGFLGGDTFVMANSDTILDFDVAEAIRFHRDRGALVTLAVARPQNPDYYLNRANLYRSLGRTEEAAADWQRASALRNRTQLQVPSAAVTGP